MSRRHFASPPYAWKTDEVGLCRVLKPVQHAFLVPVFIASLLGSLTLGRWVFGFDTCPLPFVLLVEGTA